MSHAPRMLTVLAPAVLALGACGFDRGGRASDAGPGGAVADAAAGATCQVAAPGDDRTVATTRGLVRGEEVGGVLRFRGIPFAAPPRGDLRFRPPEDHACWDGVLDADEFGARCPQLGPTSGEPTGDEDCLFLNVWTPSASSGGPRPVLFWIHGGAQVAGSASDATPPLSYDGQLLAESHDAVVVSTNYRLGALGFLAHPALDAESAHGASGNYGLLDLVQALTWVRDNIASFGGDPDRVMVFGESAGAFNTCGLVGSPLAAGLFHGALMQSGVCDAPTLAQRQVRGLEVAEEIGCDGASDLVSCLRDAPVADLVATSTFDVGLAVGNPATPIDPARVADLSFGLTVDGWALPASPRAAMAAGTHNRVPMVIGTNANEFDLFLLPGSVTTCTAYRDRLDATFGEELAAAVLAEYPCPGWWAAQNSYSDVMSDMFLTCPSRRAARASQAGQSEPVRRYLFTHRRVLGPMAALRAAHAVEIPFVFRAIGSLAEPATAGEMDLADRIGRYWTRFAATADPNGEDDPAWTTCGDGCDQVLVLDDDTEMADTAATTRCDFWDGITP